MCVAAPRAPRGTHFCDRTWCSVQVLSTQQERDDAERSAREVTARMKRVLEEKQVRS